MSDVDYYDVQAMIRDARSEIRGEIDNAVRGAIAELRDELRETHRYFQQECDSIMRVLNSRTEHLA